MSEYHSKEDLEIIGKSKNGVEVKYDSVSSHAATHFEDTPNLKQLVTEVISGIELGEEEIKTQVDMGRVVGTCDVVEIDSTDELVYGIRKNREDDGLVPFTKSREGAPCPYVAVHLIPQPDNTYTLSSAWIGTFGEDDEPFPGSPNANERSVDFWNKHAFVYGSQEILEGTETAIKPW